MDVVCCDIRVVSSRKRRGERVGVGSRGKYPGAPPHHKGKRNQADRKRYLIGLLGEKGKAKKKKNYYSCIATTGRKPIASTAVMIRY
jgi:hypothetical protein